MLVGVGESREEDLVGSRRERDPPFQEPVEEPRVRAAGRAGADVADRARLGRALAGGADEQADQGPDR